jgi:HD-GYP domain-containing protein (c-di-GMP phosphodiesterase class II)
MEIGSDRPNRRVRGIKLPSRLGLLFLAAGVVPLAVTMLVLAPRGQDALRTSAKLLHQAEVESLRARIDATIDDLLADVRLLALPESPGSNPNVPHSSAERRALLRFLLEKHKELTCVTLFNGTERVAGGQAYDRRLVVAEDLEVHQRKAASLLSAFHDGDTVASEFYPSAKRKEMLVTIVISFRALGEKGRLAAEISLKQIQEFVAETHIGRRGSAFVVDGGGRLVAHQNLERALKRDDLSKLSVVAQLVQNISSAASTGHPLTVVTDFTDEGLEQVGAFAPLGRLRWGVVVEEPRDDAYGLARATWAHAAAWTLLALLVTLLVAVFFARNMTRPLERLMDSTDGLAGGSFGISVPIEGPPEIAELARTFNAASRELARYDHENRNLLAKVEQGYLETLRALVNAIEAKDPYTAGHSQRTAEYAVATGRALGLSDAELREIEFGGLLHDIGKIGIAEQILRKPAALDDSEMKVMRGHPAIGDGVVRDIEILATIRSMVRSHHERWDGSGYPDGLRGHAIPLGARIVAVADTYDAITSDRCYQPGRSGKEAVAILQRLANRQLDGEAVAALIRALVEIGAIEQNGLEQVPVMALAPQRPHRPTLENVVAAVKKT